MKIEPQMDRLCGGNNHKSFTVCEAPHGDKRRQLWCSSGITWRLRKTTWTTWSIRLVLPRTYNICFSALIANKTLCLWLTVVKWQSSTVRCSTPAAETIIYKWAFWCIDYYIIVDMIEIDWIAKLLAGAKERSAAWEAERVRSGRETGRARGEGAESMLTSIQEEDILSLYAAHVIFIA